ncbi:hypothetical protein [Haloferax denitrificans]|nr:hypothetical protein [Haloferax denitrificans]
MTWTWRIDGEGEQSQTLVVTDDSGAEVSSTTANGFLWPVDDCPEFVYQAVVNNDVQAALAGDIEREK